MPVIGGNNKPMVNNHFGSVEDMPSEGNNQIIQAINELSKKIQSNSSDQIVIKVSEGDLTLKSKGSMIWWTKIEDAAGYRIILKVQDEVAYINNTFDEIDLIQKERSCCYHVFQDLPKAGRNHDDFIRFMATVEAEDRNGCLLASATITVQ